MRLPVCSRVTPLRVRWLAVISLFAAGLVSQISMAQQSSDIEVLQVRPNFYLIAGAGGNIAVQTGPDGVIVVDSGSTANSAKVLAEIKKLSDQPIRYIFNTSAEPDHVGGNETLSKGGRTLYPLADTLAVDLANAMTGGGNAPVLAAENVLLRMSAPTGKQSPFPEALWPSETFNAKLKYFYLNGEAIELMHQPAAHSDGDSMVFFRRSDVVVTGDILDITRFPVIDLAKGGSIQGELDALNRLVEMVIPPIPFVWREGGTYVIPGHGRICEQSDVVEYRDMVTVIRDIVQDMIKQGMTLEQVKAAEPTKGYTTRYGSNSGPWTTNAFVEAVYKSLTAK